MTNVPFHMRGYFLNVLYGVVKSVFLSQLRFCFNYKYCFLRTICLTAPICTVHESQVPAPVNARDSKKQSRELSRPNTKPILGVAPI
jgi:hypothetical protein